MPSCTPIWIFEESMLGSNLSSSPTSARRWVSDFVMSPTLKAFRFFEGAHHGRVCGPDEGAATLRYCEVPGSGRRTKARASSIRRDLRLHAARPSLAAFGLCERGF